MHVRMRLRVHAHMCVSMHVQARGFDKTSAISAAMPSNEQIIDWARPLLF